MELNQILESFYDYYKSPSYINTKEYPVHKNPSKKEIREVSEETEDIDGVRFIADPELQEIYIFPANVLHEDVIKEIYNNKPEYVLFGIAMKKEGKYKAEFGQIYGKEIKQENYYESILRKDWEWLGKYFDLAPFFDTVMRRYRGK